jgi:protein ImuB
MMQRRLLALWFPRLPTDRLRRGAAPDIPLALAGKSGNALRLTALDESAARRGLKPGMPLADARAMIEPLEIVAADPVADARLLERIADWCDRFTPLVALDPPQGLLLDVTGIAPLFGGEAALLTTVRDALARQGFCVQAALTGTAMASRALAHYADGRIVPPGKEAEAVAPLPVEALALDPLTAHGLRRAGLKTVGQVGARARAELAARFGAAMLQALDRALGRDEAPISPRHPLPAAMAEHRFAEPVATEEMIAASLRALAAALAALLEERGQGARRAEAVFFRADGIVRRLAVTMGKPLRDPDLILRLFRERLAALADPLEAGFGFDLIRLEVSHTGPMTPVPAGFAGNDAQDEARQIEALIDALTARLGRDRVLSFRPQDTYIPEKAGLAVSAQGARASRLSWDALKSGDELPRRPLRLFEIPEPIEVMAEVPEGPPLRFRWRRALHKVARAEGPERIAMEWWRAAGPTRDYFRVEDEAGQRFWLYRSGLYGREAGDPDWYVHGLFA